MSIRVRTRSIRFVFSALLCLHGIGGLLLAQSSQESAELAGLIATGNAEAKRDALFRIRNFRTAEAARIALPALRDRDEMVRATAPASVVYLPADEAVAALLPLLGDRSEFVRREAAYALGTVGDDRASGPLIRLLQRDKAYEVRTAAAVALGRAGGPAAIAPLAAVFKSRPDEDNDFIRRSAARSIGNIAQILRTGRHDVLTPQNFLPERFKSVVSGDDLAAGQPAIAAAVPILSSVLRNRREADDTRREAAYALGAIGSRSVIGLLETETASPDPYLAEIAKEALLRIRSAAP